MKTVFRLSNMLLLVAFGGMADADDQESIRSADLLPPVRVTAGGQPILAQGRCAALTIGDIDEDGKADLLVGQISEGRLLVHRNVGTVAQPEFAPAVDFMAEGEPAGVPTGCYTAFNPQLIDFDGDGRTDILTPSFNNGIYVFCRSEDGTFSEAVMLEDRHSQPFEFRYNGAALAYDWDADGDLDLLVRGGLPDARPGINLIVNEGSRQEPAYAEPQQIRCDGAPLNAKPCAIVDWDGDGKDDLLACAGSVRWYRNTGETGKPDLQPAVVLVPSGSYQTMERSREEPLRLPDEPGRIDSICVADVNGDGRLDLLGASTWCDNVVDPELTAEQQATEAELRAQYSVLIKKCGELRKTPANEDRNARVARQRAYLQAWRESAALRAAWDKYNSRHDYCCVWLYQRTLD